MRSTFRGSLRWILLLYLPLALLFTWATPIFEASDEYVHFGMVEFIAQNHDLPVQRPGEDTPYLQEGSQPPLYYALAAALVTPIDISDAAELRVINPHAAIGQPESPGNTNRIVHKSRFPPLEGAALGVYVIRLFSILLGTVTIAAVYHSARMLAPNRPTVWTLAAGLTAFNPMFLFITASVNNDNLVTALASVVIYLTLRTLRDGFDTGRSLLMAFLIAMATLSKLSGLVLVPTVAVLALWIAWRDRNLSGLVLLGSAMLGIWLLLAGWWYARNLILYDELFGTHMMVQVAGPRPAPFTLETALAEFEGFRWSFWGVFGLFTILVPTYWFYFALDVLTLLSGVGLVMQLVTLVRRRHADDSRDMLMRMGFLFAVLGIGFVAFLSWTAQTFASQGRLLFPYMAAIMPLMALGLVALVERVGLWLSSDYNLSRYRRYALLPLPALAVAALLIPPLVIAPDYRIVQPIADVPTDANQVDVRFENVKLLAYQPPDQRFEPGERVPVTLYWQVEEQAERDNSLFLSLIGPQGREVGKLNTYPGAGTLRTSTWTPGAIYPDTYHIRLHEDVSGRFPLRLQLGWWHYPTQRYLTASNENGQRVDTVVLKLGAVVDPGAAPSTDGFTMTDRPAFGDVIRLAGYDLQGMSLRLLWEAQGNPAMDYTVFVQALDDGVIVAQGDAPPGLPTRYWRPGERYVSEHTIRTVEAREVGRYPLVIGWYNPSNFNRLATDSPDNAYRLTQITLSEEAE